MWMKSKTGMWHLQGTKLYFGHVAKCQSHNLDRANLLEDGTATDDLPDDARRCKKCLSNRSK